jgi:hypothetical protein
MKNFLLTAMILGSTAVFSQVLGLSGFEVFDDASFKMTFGTEKEAVVKYQAIIDVNGFDTTAIKIDWGNNPVSFESFRATSKGMVNIGIIVRFEGKYEVLFKTVPNKDTKLFEVLDNDGVIVELIYDKRKF